MCVITAAMMGGSMMAATAANVGIVGSVISAAGQIEQGKAQQEAGEYSATVQENNAKVSDWKAKDAIDRGIMEERVHLQKATKLKGRQRTVLAAQGIVLDSGSAADIIEDTDLLSDYDAQIIDANAQREAYDHKVAASNQRAQADMDRTAGENAYRASQFNAMSSLLSGASSTADRWYRYSQ